jgi:hypothetical protein
MFETIRTKTAKVEPVTLDESKNFLNTEYTDDDRNLIPSLCTAARELAEQFCNRSFVAQTIEYSEVIDADELEYQYVIKLPYPDHLSVDEVKINGVVNTDYVKTGTTRLSVYLTGLATGEAGVCEVYVKYKASGTCPEMVKTAIKQIVKDSYENRGKDLMSNNGLTLLMPYKVY